MSAGGSGSGTVPDVVRVAGGRPLEGTVRTPGDKSVSHRVLLLGALAEGPSTFTGLSDGDDVAATGRAVVALGATVEGRAGPDGTVTVEGGRPRLRPADGAIDCANSGTSMRLLAGLVAGIAGHHTLVGDASLSGRPMDRVAEPLRAMGAGVFGRGPRCLPPLAVAGGPLAAVDWTPPMASAQVKGAILLAGLSATGETVVREPVPTRAHTEELLSLAGADITVEAEGPSRVVRVRPSALRPFSLAVPGDPSQAAFFVVAGCLVPGSEVTVAHVYAGLERLGFVDVLARMGALVEVDPEGDGAATISARFGPLSSTTVEAAEIPSLDEVPVLAVAAAAAEGTTVFRAVGELRVKETDRLAAVVELVAAFGAEAEVRGDELAVHGVGRPARLRPGTFDSGGDHRMAMAAAVAAAAAGDGESEVRGFASVATSYPSFLADLERLRGGSS
ncbi:MAG TPA: 3-phosphoshikimate 1-carboxyvinyltransferase [Acidimicrobiales bacterium]|nr:3-phosphoshikimate 1-carboxyvinyltransferase [Acidimicrobiales bacterium]